MLLVLEDLLLLVCAEVRLVVILVVVRVVHHVHVQVFVLVLIVVLLMVVQGIILFLLLLHFNLRMPIQERSTHFLGQFAPHEVVVVRRVLLVQQVVQRLVQVLHVLRQLRRRLVFFLFQHVAPGEPLLEKLGHDGVGERGFQVNLLRLLPG